jgi:Tfp pilus assembly protein PilO
MALNYKSSLSRYRRYLQMVQSRPLLATSLWVILSLILLIVLLVLALRPTLITIADLVAKIEQQREISQRLEAQMLTVQQAATNLDAVRDKLDLLDSGLPKEAAWNELAWGLSGMATSSGLALDSIVINKIPLSPTELAGNKQETVIISTPQGIIPVRFTIVATGDYEQIRRLVELVEKMRRISIIDRMQIDTTKEGAVKVIIQAETGYLPDKFVL